MRRNVVSTVYNNISYPTADIDECASPELNECGENSICTNTEGSYVCRCVRGYTGDGKSCTGTAERM